MPRRKSEDERWDSKFGRFIEAYGVQRLALDLDVSPSAIYHWIGSRGAPRPAHAEIIQRVARERGYSLTMEQIYGHSREVRADEGPFSFSIGSAVPQGRRALPIPKAYQWV